MPRSAVAFLLFDQTTEPELTEDHFKPEWWQRRKAIVDVAQGRGTVFFTQVGDTVWALRRYLRGGWMARFNRDCYFWPGLKNSRPWREWHLLTMLREQGLPVPRPIAARVVRSGLVYTGDLITERIEASTPLCALLKQGKVTTGDWHCIGELLERFHRHGVRHDDINVSNVLRDAQSKFYLIDFDKAKIVAAGGWQAANLARFRRSIDKLGCREANCRLADEDWNALLNGYGADDALRDRIRESLEKRRRRWWQHLLPVRPQNQSPA